MTVTKLMNGLYRVPGLVNTYLLETAGGLTLIDTGFPRDTAKIIRGIVSIGRQPHDVRHILLTHAHPDHIGGAAALREASGAQVHAHRIDAPIVETGGPFRPLTSAPGLRNRIVVSILRHVMKRVAPCRVDHHLEDGVLVPFDPDLVPIRIPGHCAGQVALHWHRDGGVLFVADACINRKSMVLAAAQEDVAEARRSLEKIARLSFASACFGHGPPILENADRQFKERWLTRQNGT